MPGGRNEGLAWLRETFDVDNPRLTFYSALHVREKSRAKLGEQKAACWWFNAPLPELLKEENEAIHLLAEHGDKKHFFYLCVPTDFLLGWLEEDALDVNEADRIHLWLCAEAGRYYMTDLKKLRGEVEFAEFVMNPNEGLET